MAILSPTSTRLKSPYTTFFYTVPSPTSISSPVHPRRPSLYFLRFGPCARRLRPCLAASPGPPQHEPPNLRNSVPLKGISRIQDRVRIFFAVLFWMSLFFWASVSDKENNGRPNKGSRPRRKS